MRMASDAAAAPCCLFITDLEPLVQANKVLAFREEQAAELASACGCGKGLGDFTTMNLTMVRFGVRAQA